jgi:hypothetical protein
MRGLFNASLAWGLFRRSDQLCGVWLLVAALGGRQAIDIERFGLGRIEQELISVKLARARRVSFMG